MFLSWMGRSGRSFLIPSAAARRARLGVPPMSRASLRVRNAAEVVVGDRLPLSVGQRSHRGDEIGIGVVSSRVGSARAASAIGNGAAGARRRMTSIALRWAMVISQARTFAAGPNCG